MRLETMFEACSQICKNLSSKDPERGINTAEGRLSLVQLSDELDNLKNWCYKGDIEVQKIVRCKNCEYYKRYKKRDKKNPFEHTVISMCSLYKAQRKPEFFCANGKERSK